MPRVHPNILRWARHTAGFTLEEAADKIGLAEAGGQTPVERLAALEAGEVDPSRPLLLRMSKRYRRPLVTFYLPKPPARADRGEDFRTLLEAPSESHEALLGALLRDIQARQSLVRAILEDEEESEPLPFVGSMTQSEGVPALAHSITRTLDLSLNDFRRAHDADEAFDLLRARCAAAGIFVLLVGNLGSHHTDLPLETFRGFAVADDIAPFVVINDQDSRAAWSFTLLHELVHLWLGQTGVSNQNSRKKIEKFCDDVASELLFPAAELEQLALRPFGDFGELANTVRAIASARNLSNSMVAYRLLRAGKIDQGTWNQLRTVFREHFARERQRRRERNRQKTGGPDYYRIKRHRLGEALVDVVSRTLSSGELTTTKAGKVLGVKAHQVGQLLAPTARLRSAL